MSVSGSNEGKVVNLTPRAMNIYKQKPVGDLAKTSFITVLPEGRVAFCKEERRQTGVFHDIDVGVDIPIFSVSYGDVTFIPERKPGVLYIVSQITARAMPDRDDFVFAGELVMDDLGQIIGCVGLSHV
jgi:hypothetical protein